MPSPFRLSETRRFLRVRTSLFTMVIVWALLIQPQSTTADEQSREHLLKAGFIYNFTKFIKWPDGASQPMKSGGTILCVAGEDPFGETLDQLSEKLESKGKRLLIRRQPTNETLNSCHILFISQSEKSRLREIIEKAERRPILLIGETPGYAQNGVMINFYIEGNRIKFEINKQALERRGLKVSSELLDLARIIEGND